MKKTLGMIRAVWRTSLAKVVALFIIGIILPTAFLVYLGLHAIRAETALLRNQAQARLSETASAMQERSHEAVANQLKPFSDFVQTHGSIASTFTAADVAALRELLIQRHVELALVLNAQERTIFPYREISSCGEVGLPELHGTEQAELRAGEHLEFQRQDYREALSRYEHILHAPGLEPRWKATLEMSMASCSAKAHENKRAEEIYRQIKQDDDQMCSESGDPFGLIARSELSALARHTNQYSQAASEDATTLRTLAAGHWSLSIKSEDFYGRHLVENLQGQEKGLSADARRSVNEALETWQRRCLLVKRTSELKRSTWDPANGALASAHRLGRGTVLLADAHAIVYVPFTAPRTGARRFSLVAMIPQRPLIDAWQRELQPLALAARTKYRIKSMDRTLLEFPPSTMLGNSWMWQWPIEDLVPGVTLAVAPLRDFPLERAASQRQKIYIAMVALAAFVIVAALFTVAFAVRREIEVAQLKAGFVASISHELKTPLSIIALIGQTLKLNRFQSAEEVQDYYGMLTEETDRLKQLIDEVLDFSRLMENRRPFRRQETDLAAVVQKALERSTRSAAPRPVTTAFVPQTTPFMAYVDPEAIERVMLNLIDNAIKYSPLDRTHIEISLRREGANVILEVGDQGYGIPSDEIGSVFERFFRGRSATHYQKTNGAGLGLSLVRYIIEAHGGTVSVKSQENMGSRFTLRFPSDFRS